MIERIEASSEDRPGYAFTARDERIERTLSFDEIDLDRDLAMLRAWFGYEHPKPYWQLDQPLPAFERTMSEKLARTHHTMYLGYLDHVPMSYWEVYRAAEDDLATQYDARDTDIGVHVLIGPPEYLDHGYGTAFLEALVRFQFERTDAQRIVSEPDVRNERAIRVFEKCGFEREEVVHLPEKDAQLLVCPRSRFEDETERHG